MEGTIRKSALSAAHQAMAWHPVQVGVDLSLRLLQKLVLRCAPSIQLRVVPGAAEKPYSLEVLTQGPTENPDIEARVQQVIADELLREEIAARAALDPLELIKRALRERRE